MTHPTTRPAGATSTSRPTAADLATLPLLYPNLAGVDVGSREHYVSVPPDRAESPVRTFGCTTPELAALAAWLKQCGITDVVLESTGVYWIPVASVLEAEGLRVALVDAREAHRLSARKSDVHDCQWLRQLFACGLLNPVFRPAPALLPARALWRQRRELVDLCATALQHMHKALELMNLQLHKVLTDVAGATGLDIIRAIVAGARDPEAFLHLIRVGCKASRDEFRDALTGHYADEHVFALRQALARFDLYQAQMAQLDQTLHACLTKLPDAPGYDSTAPAPVPKSRDGKRRKNQSHFNLAHEVQRLTGVDLTRIEGIDALTAFTVVAEQGLDMSAFPTEKHFASHLGLCPNHAITGGRIRKRKTRRVHSRAARALRLAAQSLARSQTALGAFYRRMRARHGAPKAIVATAHKLAKYIYRMLKHGEAYVAKGVEEYEAQYRERLLKNLAKQARTLGCEILVQDTGEILS
jgi:transposase